jgi:hypothetical protein
VEDALAVLVLFRLGQSLQQGVKVDRLLVGHREAERAFGLVHGNAPKC